MIYIKLYQNTTNNKVQSYKNTKLQPIQRFANGIIQKIKSENIRIVHLLLEKTFDERQKTEVKQ